MNKYKSQIAFFNYSSPSDIVEHLKHLSKKFSLELSVFGYLESSPIGQNSVRSIRAQWLAILQPGDFGGGVSIHVTLKLGGFID